MIAFTNAKQVLRIRRSDQEGLVIFAFSGRIEEQQLPELARLLDAEEEHHEIVFDLGELRLVHRRVVRFLGECEARGIRLQNCPSYIRKWIETGSDKEHEPDC